MIKAQLATVTFGRYVASIRRMDVSDGFLAEHSPTHSYIIATYHARD